MTEIMKELQPHIPQDTQMDIQQDPEELLQGIPQDTQMDIQQDPVVVEMLTTGLANIVVLKEISRTFGAYQEITTRYATQLVSLLIDSVDSRNRKCSWCQGRA